MKIQKTALAGVAALVLSAATLGTTIGTASAEPTGTPTFRALAGVGSDTTQDVVNGLSEVVTDGAGTKLIGSYNAFGGGTIQTKSTSNCTIVRPNGSSQGRAALVKALNPSDPTFGCLDFARSSSLTLTATPAGQGLTYVPFGVDAVTYAVAAGSELPRNLTKAELVSIYKCEIPGLTPLLPQGGSGTRSFWLAQLGLTETTFGSCVKDQKNGVPVQEHDGRVLTATTDIVPFSVAQYLSQAFGVITDVRGQATLGTIDGIAPVVLNTGFGVKRDVYNVIPTSKIGTSPWAETFVGSASKVCAQTTVIQRYGFGTNANCGSTTNQTPTS